MIAKIGRSANLFGALAYNNLKVEKENGQILFTNKIIETPDGKYSVAQLAQSFAPYLLANRNTRKHTLHISLNPNPNDKVSDDTYREMAQQYMHEMGYGEQPFVVFKHTDIERSHIHIVSVCVDENGKKISDKFEKVRSMKVCRDLEKQLHLIPATDKDRKQNNRIFKPLNYKAGDVKSQMASVIRHLPNYYQFQTLGEYNALLSLFNITTEKIEGELHGEMRRGLVYIPLNDQGQKTGTPFKASLFGKNAGLSALELHFAKCKTTLKDHPAKETLKATVTIALQATSDEVEFKKQLGEQGINVVVRRNDTGRIYGMTFIDHNSKTVWNGSRLAKELSANIFNDCWNNNIKPVVKVVKERETQIFRSRDKEDLSTEKPHPIFEIDLPERLDYGLIDAFSGLFMFETQGEDYEEELFARRMKKKKKNGTEDEIITNAQDSKARIFQIQTMIKINILIISLVLVFNNYIILIISYMDK